MDELQKQLSELESQKVALFDSGNPDQEELQRINGKIKEVQAQIDAQLSQAAVIAEVQDPESSFVLVVGGLTVDFRDFARDEEAYQALAIATRLKLQELEVANQAEQQAMKDSYEAEKKAAEAKYDVLAEEYRQTKLERDDFQERWDTAAKERDSLAVENKAQKEEIESLRRQVEELRATINKPAQVATNLDSNALADAIKKANAAKPAVYNLREHNGHYLANLADTDEEININWLDKGKYRVLSDEEAARFREDREEAKKAALESVPEVAASLDTVEPPQFQTEGDPVEEEHTLLRESTTEGPGDVAQVTREEFDALVKRVVDIESRINADSPNVEAA